MVRKKPGDQLTDEEIEELEGTLATAASECQRAAEAIGRALTENRITRGIGIIAMRALSKDNMERLGRDELANLELLESFLTYGETGKDLGKH